MKKRMLRRLLVATALISFVFPLTVAQAATTSTGEVGFFEGDDPTKPRDPDDPNQELPENPEGNQVTEEKGPLSIDVVPLSFSFGTQKIYDEQHDYNAQKGEKQYLQITDNRGSEKGGWILKVRQDQELTDQKTGKKLSGAALKLPAGIIKNTIAEETMNLKSNSVTVSAEEQIIFQTSNSQNGKGTSVCSWSPEEVVLSIPRDTAEAGSYQNKIYWILTDQGPLN